MTSNISDNLNAKAIEKYLNVKCPVEVLDTVDSTNNYIKKYAGGNGSCAVIADSQTGGRGRFNRKFYSPEGCGIYMSVMLYPDLPAEKAVLLTAAAAVAVCGAVEALTEREPKIKWVNDILIDSKKVCGILAEAAFNSESRKTERAVVGIGINVYKPCGGFAEEIKSVAGYIREKHTENFRNRLCAEIINRLVALSKRLEDKSIFEEYSLRCAVIGKAVTVLRVNCTPQEAVAVGLDDNFRLLVEYNDKTSEYLSSGEISIKINNG